MRTRTLALPMLACLWLSPVAQASSMYEFRFDQSTYEVAPGGTVTVSVYLYETVTAGDTSMLATDPLVSTGVRISYGSATNPSQPATATVADVNAAPAFTNEPYDNVVILSAAEVQDGGAGAPDPIVGLDVSSWTAVPGQVVPGTDGKQYSVLIGTVTFTAGDVVGETTTIKASDLYTGSTETYLNSFTSLDSAPIWTGTAQITVVPEPACWVGLAGMGLTAGIFWKIRSRRLRRA